MAAFDPFYLAEISASADRLEQTAVTVRHRAAALAAGAEQCPWDGSGARAFRAGAASTVARLRRAALRLDEGAAALRRHGATVGSALAARDAERARHDRAFRDLVSR